jgi:hypothetical protein
MIGAQTKRVVRAIYAFRCGYCGVSEAQTGAELTYDHFRPQSRGGSDEVSNLVYACHACNEFKGDYWSEGEETRLLHPLIDDLKEHIVEEMTGSLRSLTGLGQVLIDRLQLNRPVLVEHRLERQRLSRIESQLVDMTVTLREILAAIQALQAEDPPQE